MNTNTFKYTLFLSLFSLSVLTSAQDKKDQTPPAQQPPAGGTLIEEIEVVRPYKPVLADAVKIRRNPDMNTVAAFKPVLTYNIIDKKLDLNTNIKELQAQKMADEPAVVLVNNYRSVQPILDISKSLIDGNQERPKSVEISMPSPSTPARTRPPPSEMSALTTRPGVVERTNVLVSSSLT